MLSERGYVSQTLFAIQLTLPILYRLLPIIQSHTVRRASESHERVLSLGWTNK